MATKANSKSKAKAKMSKTTKRSKSSKKSASSNFLVGGIKSQSLLKTVFLSAIIVLVLAVLSFTGWYVYKDHEINQTRAAAASWTKLGEITTAAPISCDHPGTDECTNPYPAPGQAGKTMTLKYYACRVAHNAYTDRSGGGRVVNSNNSQYPVATYASFKFFVASSFKFPLNKTERVTGIKVMPDTATQSTYFYPDSRDIAGSNQWWAGVAQSFRGTMNVQGDGFWKLQPFFGGGATFTGQRLTSGVVSQLPAVNVAKVVTCQ